MSHMKTSASLQSTSLRGGFTVRTCWDHFLGFSTTRAKSYQRREVRLYCFKVSIWISFCGSF
ncbi:hypothetical protein SLEP1_g38614 [Rubroshorea leprosula]|uniref:Uncharacterized protein n=1 Tax=Rubroshorea leprosula TaxID=152421 RepID=A0AAV5KXL6_9ROSI|nr:hypothetical protein SLEP1_g38614 [Rubroshorea leprosula]